MVKRGVVWRRWQRTLSEYWASDLTVAEYCRRHGLRTKTALRWVRRLRPETKNSEPLEIVPVKLTSQVELPRLSPRVARDSGIRLELGTLNVRLSADFDAEALRRVLSVLEGR